MKNLLLFSFFAICLLASCGDSVECVQADYVGTWTGTEDCTGVDVADVTINIIASGTDQVEIDGGQFVTDLVNLDNCKVSRNNTLLGSGWEYRGDIDGTNLTLTHSVVAGGTTGTVCTYTLTKQ